MSTAQKTFQINLIFGSFHLSQISQFHAIQRTNMCNQITVMYRKKFLPLNLPLSDHENISWTRNMMLIVKKFFEAQLRENKKKV